MNGEKVDGLNLLQLWPISFFTKEYKYIKKYCLTNIQIKNKFINKFKKVLFSESITNIIVLI